MLDLSERPNLGPYVLTRMLPSSDRAERWVALHEGDQSSHLVYQFPVLGDKAAMRRLVAAVEAARKLDHPHLLSIEYFSFDVAGRAWIVTPYPGDAAGLMTLGKLLREKGGQMSPDEAERAVVQLLQGLDHAHGRGICHGPIGMDDVLVDRRGSVIVELYGLDRLCQTVRLGETVRVDPEVVRDEVRSAVEIGYQLVTGVRAETPVIPAARLVKKLDRGWSSWLDRGLGPIDPFETAGEALEALRSGRRAAAAEPRPSIVTVLGLRRSAPSDR